MADQPWRYEEDGYTVTRSCIWSPPGCHPVGCGAKLYVKDGKLERIEGDENHPVSQGRLCPRCLSHVQYMYHPDRVLHPLKRAGERGEGKWEQITWDEAYDIIEQKVKACKEEYGPESIVTLGGTGREGGPLIGLHGQRMLGTPNACYPQSGYACYIPRVAAAVYNIGSPYPEIDNAGGFADRYDDPRFELPEVIVLWGKEPMPSNPDGFFGYSVLDMMRRGAKLISVDPRLNWVASRAVYHLRVRPGTDACMALAWLNVIINEDLYDHDFVDRWTYGFDQLKERVQEYPPSRAAEVCGVEEEKIVAAARLYAQAKSASIAWGLATDQKPNGLQHGHAILCLMAITGNIDVPGGQLLGPAGDVLSGADSGYEILPQEVQDKIIGLKEYPAYVALCQNSHADLTFKAIATGEPYPIRVVGIMSTNLIAGTCGADPHAWHDALAKVDFVFATDCFITPTIQCCADIVLPLTTMAEHDTVVATHYGASPVTTGANNMACDPGDCKCDLQIMMELGSRIMPKNFRRYKTYEDFIDDFHLSGKESSLGEYAENGKMTFAQLREMVVVQRPTTYRKYETGNLRPDGQPGFDTPTGRVELYSTTFERFGEDPLPYYIEPPYSPVSTPELMEEYPFVLTTGARTHAFFHSENRMQDYCRELNPDPLIEINPADAEKQGIADGDWCYVNNQFGECLLKAKVSEAVKAGVVHAQHGWWFPEEDGTEPHLFGVWRSNINCLIPSFHIGKLGFGAPYKCIICNVRKAEAEDYEKLGGVTPWHATVS